MKFTATEFRRDGEYGVVVNAPSWAEAKRLCAINEWRLDGEIKAIIPASQTFGEKEADELIDAANQAQDAVRH